MILGFLKKPGLEIENYLKVFSCLSYVLINNNERNKLDSKLKKYYFIDYCINEFGYRFWDYENNEIIININIIFKENEIYNDKSRIIKKENLKVQSKLNLKNQFIW